MTKARTQQVSLQATPYYHCVSRCVRRAFLGGEGFEHRFGWVEDKLLALAEVFCIEVAAYAVMPDHYHLVLHINTPQAEQLSKLAVIERWHQLFKGSLLSQRYCRGEKLLKAEQLTLDDLIVTWRQRLQDISWFLRLLNEAIARQANQEDQCRGRFWEGRFKSQALLDDQALLACMAYVDLNPLRTQTAKSPANSPYTSIKKRIAKAKTAHQVNHPRQQEQSLMPFAGKPRQNMPEGIPCRLSDYLELVDWTARIVRKKKQGAIEKQVPPLLAQLSIGAKNWLILSTQFEQRFGRVIGTPKHLRPACTTLDYQRIPGMTNSKLLFEDA
ncbi:transposase [Gammaproteobacteria bacterium 53_120_T64]|nr:transposase [Gammaproteobacteria bacterium 53_120_T64]